MSNLPLVLCKLAPLAVDLNKETISLTMKSNSFDELLPYNKPGLKNFVMTSGCSSFVLSHIDDNKRGVWRYWLLLYVPLRDCFESSFIHVDESDSRVK